jgi:DNA-binding transcriptional LysR family regulator
MPDTFGNIIRHAPLPLFSAMDKPEALASDRDMKLTFRQIEAFQHVIATGSVTDAAAILGVSQPAVSRLLADFEAQVGFRLFQRAGRTLHPTPEARMLVDTVRRAFGGLDRIREAAEAIRDFNAVPLRLVTTSSFAVRVLPDLVAEFARHRPGASISLDVQSTDDAVEWLTLEAYDFGFTCAPSASPRLKRRTVLTGEAVCLVPDGHALAARSIVSATDLGGQNLIAYRADAQFRHQLDLVLAAAGAVPVVRHEARTTEAMIRLVERGLGIAVIGTARAEDYSLRGCRIIPFRPAMPFALQMIWSTHRAMTAVAADFAEMIEKFAPLSGPSGDTLADPGPRAS